MVLWVSGGRRIVFRENESSAGDICVCVGIFHQFLYLSNSRACNVFPGPVRLDCECCPGLCFSGCNNMSLVFIFNPYFLSFRADILFVLLAVENFLPYVSSPSPSSPSYIPVLASSCLSLLHTLSVVTSPLSLLSTSLEATPISPPPHHSHKTHPQWLQYVDLTHSGIQATSNGITDDAVRIFKNFVSFPYPSWHLLIKVRKQPLEMCIHPFFLVSA